MQHAAISVIGLGKLGSPLVGVLANSGHKVIGVDVNPAFVDALNAGEPPVEEPRLKDYISNNAVNISATTDYAVAILNTDVTFIIVPTPSQANGFFTNRFVLSALEQIALRLKEKLSRHLIVITSTVMPGSTQNEFVPLLEHLSGKTVGKEIGLCYSPHFIALGTVIRNMEQPDFIMVGESDLQSGAQLESIYRTFCQKDTPIHHMNYVNAELTKISINSFITTKISFANMLSDLCDKMPGANVDVITHSMGQDRRIGHAYLKAGSAYGGPCFPRDNIAFSQFAKSLNARPDIALSADTINNYQTERVMAYLQQLQPTCVIVIGLSYKSDCDYALVSFGVSLANTIATEDRTVIAFDPNITSTTKTSLDDGVRLVTDFKACTQSAECIILTNPLTGIIEQLASLLADNPNNTYHIIDCWRHYGALRDYGNCRLIQLGVADELLKDTHSQTMVEV